MLFINKDGLGFLLILLIIILFILLIRAVFRAIKHLFLFIFTGKRQNKKPLKSDDWLTRAQARQEIRIKNSLPPLRAEAKPHRKSFAEKRNERKGKSPTGWTLNEDSQLWEPPKNIK